MNRHLTEYLVKIELRLLENPIYSGYTFLRKDILYSEAKVRIKIELVNSDTIELFEYSVENDKTIISKKYSYHWQNSEGLLIKRWDNAPHYQGLDNFPHHIHLNDENVQPNESVPNILTFLEEIETHIVT
jgi:hypothetical protein